MKSYFLLWSLVFSIAAVMHIGQAAEPVTVITARKDIQKHIGEKVTIVGVVSNTKMPQILGVDVGSDNPDLRGKKAEATGILERYEITSAEVAEMNRDGIAHRGAGVFYRLRDEKRKAEAQVREPK